MLNDHCHLVFLNQKGRMASLKGRQMNWFADPLVVIRVQLLTLTLERPDDSSNHVPSNAVTCHTARELSPALCPGLVHAASSSSLPCKWWRNREKMQWKFCINKCKLLWVGNFGKYRKYLEKIQNSVLFWIQKTKTSCFILHVLLFLFFYQLH